MAFGDKGLIQQAELAKDLTVNSIEYETEAMANLTAYMQEEFGESSIPETPEGPTIPDDWDKSKVDAVESEDGVVVPVPKGFTASKATGEKSVNTGFVIYQGTDEVNDSNVKEAQRSRNQFVWIPVNDESLAEMYNTTDPNSAADITLSKSTLGEEATTTKLYSKLRGVTGGAPGSNSYREPDILTSTLGDASTRADRGINLLKSELGYSGSNAEVLKEFAQDMVNEYEAVFNSIKKYDGFYIGRFEITGDVENPTVQKDGTVITDQNWYNLKKACSNVVVEGEEYGAQSTMIYGNQWDEVMAWLVATGDKTESQINTNSKDWGNYSDSTGVAETNSGSKQTAGKNEAWQANNIYDLAGNCWEWTQEAQVTTSRIYRGGAYNNSGSSAPSSDRNNFNPNVTSSSYSSRPALYVVLNDE